MFDLNEAIAYIIYVMQKRSRRIMSMALDKDDITLEQFAVLYNLMDLDGINQKQLAAKVDKDQATLARILDILENRGLVQRRTTEKDRRAFLVFITEDGISKVKEIARRLEEVHDKIVAGIPEENVKLFKDIAKQINNNLKK